jgi:type I restriction enzyme M protein
LLMLTGEIRNQVDRIWDAFWTGGISNPLEVIEQLTYLLFIKRLDDIHTVQESLSRQLGEGKLVFTPEQEHFRWSVFKNREPANMYGIIANEIFPFIREMGKGEATTFARHMKDARFTLPPEKAGLLSKVVELLSTIQMDDRDTKGDLYEYLLSKLATSGQNGQFRTPRHIIQLMIELTQPNPDDVICDPACGTAGFLVAALEYLLGHHRTQIYTKKKDHFENKMFNAFDFDSTMLRVASMNMMLHGVANANIQNKDSLSDTNQESDLYTLILANPPFKGSLQFEAAAKDLTTALGMKAPKARKDGKPSGVQAKTELMFMLLFLRLLKTGGRCAVIVPDGVLFGSSSAHQTVRRKLVEDHKLEAIISMPSGVFKPYAGVSTAIVLFTKTGIGGTENVWFYDMRSDGFSLDDKRNPVADNDIPDIIAKWRGLASTGSTGSPAESSPAEANTLIPSTGSGIRVEGSRTEQSFFVPKDEISAQNYDLSINRYKETIHEAVHYDPPQKILDELDKLEQDIQAGLSELRGMLN